MIHHSIHLYTLDDSSSTCLDFSYIFTMDDKPYMPTYQVSKEKVKSLGIELTLLEVSIKESRRLWKI